MKISQIIFATLLQLCIFGICFVYSQESDSKKDKPKDNNAASSLVEVKANLVVLDADNKYVNDVKLEDLKIYEDGNEQKITRFVKKQNALSVGFVMDNTGSMKNQFGKMEAAAAEFVKNLRPQDEAFVVRFVDSDTVEIIQDWTTDKAVLNDTLASMYIEGGKSAVIDALYLSAEKMLAREKADSSKRCALILFSDGDERDSYYETKELLALLKGSDVQIFVIGLAQDLSDKKNEYTKKKNSKTNAKNLINRLALQTGGAAFFPVFTATGNEPYPIAKSAEMVRAIKTILIELQAQYIVGYTSTNQKRDGSLRKLTVQIADGANGAKRQTFIRESFVVPEEKNK